MDNSNTQSSGMEKKFFLERIGGIDKTPIPLPMGVYNVGRSKHADVIISSKFCNRKHCRLVVDCESVSVHIDGEKLVGGLYVNEKRFRNGKVILKEDDKIGFGTPTTLSDNEMKFYCDEVYVYKLKCTLVSAVFNNNPASVKWIPSSVLPSILKSARTPIPPERLTFPIARTTSMPSTPPIPSILLTSSMPSATSTPLTSSLPLTPPIPLNAFKKMEANIGAGQKHESKDKGLSSSMPPMPPTPPMPPMPPMPQTPPISSVPARPPTPPRPSLEEDYNYAQIAASSASVSKPSPMEVTGTKGDTNNVLDNILRAEIAKKSRFSPIVNMRLYDPEDPSHVFLED